MKTNKDGLPMKDGADVPLAAGVDKENTSVTLHDKAIPETLTMKDGKVFNLRESHDYHERVEHPLMQAGLSYEDAHRHATEAEHARIRDLGFDPNEVEELAKPHIDAAKHRAKAEGRATPSLDTQPYVDSKEPVNGEEPQDERVLYDAKGRSYHDPEQHRALGKVDFIIAQRGTTYHALEPATATVWASARSRAAVEKAIDRRVRKDGVLRVRQTIDDTVPVSQQQLKERHGG